MTPKPGAKIEITPDTRLGDLLGRRVCWRHESGKGWQRGVVTGITRNQVIVDTAHGLSYLLDYDEIYGVTK